jgi:coproporphyrinogen III oxidase-like Fe-S oxidoreductase
MFDNLIARYVRSLNERLMNFPSAMGNVEFPSPDPDHRYLLYLHIPFCVVLCPFCSFHRVEFREDRATRYFDALQQEIGLLTDAGYRFGELYVGGGTPTVMPDRLAQTIELIAEHHELGAISVETNPCELDRDSLARLKSAGVTRLSVGVQSFDDRLLKEMERYDKYGSGAQIVEHLGRLAGHFDTLNVDMIFNFPHQQAETLASDLETLTETLGVDQVSWYPLMTSSATARPMARQMGVVSHGREREFYEQIVRHMLGAGYQRSSAWCFSRHPGMFDEYIVEHEEYVGLGSGSFSYLQGTMYANTFSINNYLRLVDGGQPSVVQRRKLAEREQMRYYLLMQLFAGRLSLDEAERRFDQRFEQVMWRDIAGLKLIGAATERNGSLCLTESGFFLWVVLMREFFSGVNNFRDDMRHNIARENGRKEADFG